MNGRGGFILVVVLLIVTLLVSLVTVFISQVYLESGAAKGYFEASQSSLYAAGGVQGGAQLLQQELKNRSYSSLDDTWARPLTLDDPLQGRLRIIIEDEGAKLNLNAIVLPNGTFNQQYYDMARRLFSILKLPLEPLDAVADWVDEDSTPNPGGAESSWYQGQKEPYLPRNRPLITLEELRMVKGMAEIFDTLRPFVTVYANSGGSVVAAPININTASREILMALDEQIDKGMAERIISYRKENPFKNTAELGRVAGMEQISTRLQTRISTKGTVFRIWSEGVTGGTARTVEAVLRVNGSMANTLYWREY